jgi:hypothetical protein
MMCQKPDSLKCQIIIHVKHLKVNKYLYGQRYYKSNSAGV